MCPAMNDHFEPSRDQENAHICMIYRGEREKREFLRRYFLEGIRRNRLIGYFADTPDPRAPEGWLRETGVDSVPKARILVESAARVYAPEGRFDPESMLGKLRRFENESRAEGFRGCRLAGETSWTASNSENLNGFLEYEARVNELGHCQPFAAVCLYDASKFDGRTLYRVLRTHPYAVAHGLVIRNPFYSPRGTATWNAAERVR